MTAKKVEALERKMEQIKSDVEKKFSTMERRFTSMENRLGRVEMLRKLMEIQSETPLAVPIAKPNQDLTEIPLAKFKGKEIERSDKGGSRGEIFGGRRGGVTFGATS
ncbi:hypothetical protein IEQ34_015553 [Dendrobium chrysotoxum]|uniref:Uncharacterized protein n=1 Tax=Dendrobium chrysotoxum TaxID=161865 RepID=A0AAV7GG82_DENCH|nr:hypothetical protein IEQ34_015553 [Dendrobium chrysotoxum]